MSSNPDEILTALANEVQIYQIPEKTVAELTDVVAVDDVNHVTWSLSLTKIVTLVQAQNTNIAVDVYVSPGSGSDTTGNGSINNPYATIAHAQQQLLPSITANRPYNLILTSEIYNEPNLTINPYIYIVGNNATLKITGNITLGNSWTLNFGGQQVNWYIKNCTIDCPNGITLDFSGAFPQPNFLSLNDINLNSISVSGNQNQAISLKDVGNIGTGVNIDFQDVAGYAISGGNNNTIDLSNTSNVNQTTGFVLGTLSVGAISVSSTGSAGIQSFFMSSFVPNAISADGNNTVLLTDCNISAIPNLTGGAVWVPLSVASGVVMQYTPVYFPSVGGTVNDYFRAVDEQFGRLTYGARLNLTSSHVMTTPLNHQVYINMVSPGQVVTLPVVNDTAALIAVGQRVYVEVSVSSDPFEIRYQDNTLLLSVSPGESLYLVCDDNTTPNGTWIPEYFVRTANGLNGQVTLDGLNVSASYPTPTNYTPTSTYVKGHLEGINAALTGSSPPGTTSYAYATFSQALNSAGAIAFSDLTTYLPFIQFGAPASQIVSNLFDVTNDGNLHTIFVCKQPAGGVYTFTLNVIARTVNYNSQQNYFINIAKNGFSAANVVGIDYPFITYGTTDQSQISQSYVFKVACSYNDFIYLPVVRSAGSTSAFDTSLTPRYWQVCITQDATSFSAEYPLTVVTNNTINLATGNRYLFKAIGQTVATLPTQAAVGSLIRIDGFNANGFRISQNAGQSIKFLSQNTTVGTSGFMVSISYNPGVLLQCVVADTDFTVVSANGTFGLN